MTRDAASQPPAPDWRAIRRLYEAGGIPVRAIAQQHGVSNGMLNRRRLAEGWGERRPKEALRSRPVKRKTLLARLLRAVDDNLKLMERRMNSDEPGSAADRERDTRTIGNLTRTIGKITELQAETSTAGDSVRGRRAAEDADGRDTDRLRLEIAERILKLRERGDAR